MEGTEQAFRFTGGNKRDEIPIVPDLLSGRTAIDKSSFYDVSAGGDLCNNSYFAWLKHLLQERLDKQGDRV